MPYYVDGEDIFPEEVAQDQGWRSAGFRRVGAKTRTADSNAPLPQPGARRGKSGGAALKSEVLRAGRMPSLPRNDIKIVIRPRSGLDISKIGAVTVSDAILAAAGISQEDLCQDTLCPNLQQNIMVAGTPKRENANRYVRMRQILISGKVHELSAYETIPPSTCNSRLRPPWVLSVEDAPVPGAAREAGTFRLPLQVQMTRLFPGTLRFSVSLQLQAGARHVGADQKQKPTLSWADMARGGRESPEATTCLEKLRRDNEQLRKENARVKQEMSRLAAEMAEIRKLALSPPRRNQPPSLSRSSWIRPRHPTGLACPSVEQ
ncbi:hypothetical protein HPB49_008936 [Dermacentor silvarum]|uniref:Uncharacterized protein n=1 Tax=Dermacentor silvarum TaxID=543639 RepID=A0ACB8D3U9_DERSI|nr:hypothetical protein HPB49_008936 [Dermacentor silvarum]